MTVAAIPGGGTISGSSPHADSREMVFDANGNLVEGDDGGIYRRTSPGSSAGDWFSINGNLQVTEHARRGLRLGLGRHHQRQPGHRHDPAAGRRRQPDLGQRVDRRRRRRGGRRPDACPTISTRYSSFQNLGVLPPPRVRHDERPAEHEVFPTLTPLGVSPLPVFNFVTPVELNAITPTSLVLGAFNAIYESFDKGDTINALPASG